MERTINKMIGDQPNRHGSAEDPALPPFGFTDTAA
tara:strand:- start:460486 stop:460590 length:105 start_codon:yes stop_codon:yes gene_type:complete